MPGLPKAPVSLGCPFCGVMTDSPHESQERCIAALHEEIGRMRGILATLKPTAVPTPKAEDEGNPASLRLGLSKTELV